MYIVFRAPPIRALDMVFRAPPIRALMGPRALGAFIGPYF